MTDVKAGAPARPPIDPLAASRASASDTEEMSLEARAARAHQRGEKPVRVVAARVNFRHRFLDLWRNRELFAFLVRKEIKVKYKNSVLGFLWSMLNPALVLAVFFVIFTIFLKNGIPNFVIYLFSALLAWNFFQAAVQGGTSVVVWNAGIVKKVAFPREILSLASVGSAFVFLLFQSLVLFGFMLVLWHSPSWSQIWLLVPALLGVALLAAALSIFLSAVNVYMRDTQHLIEVLLTAWFWALPAVYAYPPVREKLAHHGLLWLYFLDPLVPLVMTFQRVFYAQPWVHSTVPPHLAMQVLATYPTHWYFFSDLAVIGVGALLFLGAMYVFGRLEGNFAEEL